MFGSWGVITLWEAPHTVGDTVNISGTHATTIVNIMNILGAFSFVKLINISGTNATIMNILEVFFLRKIDKHFRHIRNHCPEHFEGFSSINFTNISSTHATIVNIMSIWEPFPA